MDSIIGASGASTALHRYNILATGRAAVEASYFIEASSEKEARDAWTNGKGYRCHEEILDEYDIDIESIVDEGEVTP